MQVSGSIVASVRRTIYIVVKSGLIFRVKFLKILELIVCRRNGGLPDIDAGREFWGNDLLDTLSHGGTRFGRI